MRFLSIVLIVILWPPLLSQAAVTPRPRLVVVLAVDQLRADYLTRFEHQFLPPVLQNGKPGGFRYLMDKGAYFTQAETGHALNITAVGHATMLTGARPYIHGIVANRWYDRAVREPRYCVADPDFQIVGGKGGANTGRSPRALLVTTVGDELKNAMGGKPKVASIAYKDRSSILMGGHRPDLALWWSDSERQWTTSSYYAPDGKLPKWLEDWNKFNYLEKRSPKKWEPLLAASQYFFSTPLPPETIGQGHGLGKKFPHPIEDHAAFFTSPWGNAYALDTAVKMIEGMKLGSNPGVPDLLSISLSSFDSLGHDFGPLSIEMQDASLRMDRMLADFFEALGKLVPGGLANVTIVLTADHGVQINPTLIPILKLPGGMYSWTEPLEQGNAQLRFELGLDDSDKPIASILEDNIYLDQDLLKKRGKDPKEAARKLAEWLRKQRYVASAHARIDLLEGKLPPTVVNKRLADNTHPERSGDVVYTPRPGWLMMDAHGYGPGGTEHSSAVGHDSRIPLIFFGASFKPGHYHETATLADLAPTLSTVLGILAPSGSEGHALHRALK